MDNIPDCGKSDNLIQVQPGDEVQFTKLVGYSGLPAGGESHFVQTGKVLAAFIDYAVIQVGVFEPTVVRRSDIVCHAHLKPSGPGGGA